MCVWGGGGCLSNFRPSQEGWGGALVRNKGLIERSACVRERQRDRDRGRETDRQTERQRQTDRLYFFTSDF